MPEHMGARFVGLAKFLGVGHGRALENFDVINTVPMLGQELTRKSAQLSCHVTDGNKNKAVIFYIVTKYIY